jgi:hypothetical protein
MPIPLFALPSEPQVKALTRAGLVSLLTSPEAATALKALGYTSVGPTMPLQVLRGLVEALRAAQASPMLGAKSTRIPCLRFSDALLAKTVMGSQTALNQIVAKLNARGDMYPDLDIEIPNPDVPELVLTWKVYSQDTEPQYVGRELVSNARPVLDTHRIVVTSTDDGNLRLDHDSLASNQWVTAIPEIKDTMLSATVLCRAALSSAPPPALVYLREPGTFASLVHRSLREAVFGLTMSELWDALCELGLPDLAKHFEPEFDPTLKIEWRAWPAISGPPHRIEINDTQDKHLHLTLLRMNLGTGTYQPVHTATARRTLQDVLGIAASLYSEALSQCHVNHKFIEASPGTFAQEIATASPLGPWDDIPDKDGHDPLDWLPF